MKLREFLKTSVCCADDGGAAGDLGAGGAGGTGGAGGNPTPWTTGLPDEIIGHAQAKGWDKLAPDAAAREIAKAHREAQTFVGRDPNTLLVVPKDQNDEAGWRALHTRLGVPTDPTQYKFDDVKNADGTPLSDAAVARLRATAADLKLTPDAAVRMARADLKAVSDDGATAAAERTAKITEERAALAKNWGAKAEANMFIAKGAAEKLGVTPEAVAALEGQIGYAGVMEMFLKIGAGMSEDKFVNSGGPNRNDVMSREQAIARKGELIADPEFGKRVLSGNSDALREIRNLDLLIVGDDTDASRNA